ncbi:MAG: hypothetical protein RI572_05170 [Salegentibacter sp.]|uniref:Alpha/beta hydrolase family protein n=1 Tax=Salegentibacter flavus TaxID=287099 RepID=A0A1I4ZF57_9FLAO|nr:MULTISPECIES: hypothetical protein [Salegentibacter]MDR9456783.1 hypothetical protein [Salegentibacter sp.]SFN48817.1 hypothetical protein SAMN05660413_01289 [Salegentibacter flavus]
MKRGLLLSFFIAILSFGQICSQEARIAKGTVVDTLSVQDSISETFSIYIPQDFQNGETWPVLVLFDPQGRGRLTAQLFRSIAEEQGYIIAASNEVLNKSSLQTNLPKASRLINRLLISMPVNANMVYVGGLGEGAQLASAAPLIYKDIKGVLAVGDAWANAELTDKLKTFVFSAVAGDEDAKLFNMQALVEFYKQRKFPTEINYFDGKNNEWPDSFVLSNAVNAFTLDAINRGFRESNQELVQRLFSNELESTEMLRRQRNYYQAYEKLEQMEAKYALFDVNTDELKDRMKSLRRNKVYRQQRRDFRKAENLEAEKQEEYRYLMEMDIISTNFENIGWWEYQMEELQELYEKGNLAEKKVYNRLQDFLQELSRSHFNIIMESQAGIDTKIFVSVLRTALDKEDPEAYLKIISLAGHDGDHQTALMYLEDLLKTGYDDMDALYEIDGILDLKLSKEYNDLIRKYLGESKYYKQS